jgi:hypothetical protein
MKRLNFVPCLVCSLLISSAAHAATLRTVALSGQQAPGAPDGTIFTFIRIDRPLVLNDAGQTAFFANTSDPISSGLWSEGAGSLNLVTAVGLSDPLRIVISDAGITAFAAHVIGSGIGLSGPGGSALVAREGEQAAGTPVGIVYSGFDVLRRTFLVNDAGQVAFQDFLFGSGVDSSNNHGIWAQRHGNVELVARAGDHAPGTPDGVNFSDLYGVPFSLNNLGQTAFYGALTGSGVANDAGIWSEGSGSLALVARTGNQAPGMPDGAVFNIFRISEPALNNAGQTAFLGVVAGGGVDATNSSGIWSGPAGNLSLVARSGDQAPGAPSGVNFTMSGLHSLALNDAGQIAFFATPTGAGVDSTNNRGLWSGAPGSLALVARTGDHAPGTEDGVVFANFSNLFANSNRTLILNAAGQTAFVARLTGSGISANDLGGIWATDRSGALQLIARTGDLLEVAPGDFRTVNLLAFLADPNTISTGNSDGRPSAFNNLGQIAFAATFTDGSSGIFVSNRVAVPEPATFSAILVGTPCLIFHRRRSTS